MSDCTKMDSGNIINFNNTRLSTGGALSINELINAGHRGGENLIGSLSIVNFLMELRDGSIKPGGLAIKSDRILPGSVFIYNFMGAVSPLTKNPHYEVNRLLPEFNIPNRCLDYSQNTFALETQLPEIHLPQFTNRDDLLDHLMNQTVDLRFSYTFNGDPTSKETPARAIITPDSIDDIEDLFILVPCVVDIRPNIRAIGYAYCACGRNSTWAIIILSKHECALFEGKPLNEITSIRPMIFRPNENNVQQLTLGSEIHLIDDLAEWVKPFGVS